jgi:hypothetical protein
MISLLTKPRLDVKCRVTVPGPVGLIIPVLTILNVPLIILLAERKIVFVNRSLLTCRSDAPNLLLDENAPRVLLIELLRENLPVDAVLLVVENLTEAVSCPLDNILALTVILALDEK